jgi:hypothetical protein
MDSGEGVLSAGGMGGTASVSFPINAEGFTNVLPCATRDVHISRGGLAACDLLQDFGFGEGWWGLLCPVGEMRQ